MTKQYIDEKCEEIREFIRSQFQEDILLEFEGQFRRIIWENNIPENIILCHSLTNDIGVYYNSIRMYEDDYEESEFWDDIYAELNLAEISDNEFLNCLEWDFVYRDGEFEWGVSDFSYN